MDFRTSQWAPLVINSVKTVHNPSYKAYKSVSSMQGMSSLFHRPGQNQVPSFLFSSTVAPGAARAARRTPALF
ncbi:hypothetical protein FJT64_024921 [Amphibalanus amphitrite]|uniref:Uncharacterized protein n=1 Tax=Amphibalanus amphitrite TaxID=1232801 RepID=A0A6A4WAU0_AMPAM|nr:hypothetical protein FJT64_024921 [Amphibalanus amphitrite]